jgi:nitrite reductase/ring-hydroxylating ferredoxin subunit
MNGKPEDRVDKIVSDLLRGRRLKLRGGDAEEKEAITTAARLAGTRTGAQRMNAAFRNRLAAALAQAPKQGLVTRRNALVAGLGLAAGAIGGSVIGRALEPQPYSTPSPAPDRGGVINPRDGRWIDVAALADLVEGQGKRVAAGGIGAYLFRHGSTVTAVSSICSHLPCELKWDGSNQLLACPCHPATFTADGRTTSKTYPLPTLNAVMVRVTPEGRVEVFGTA